jgi:tRNA uridine 5-carboxymethylaminomethyl modification enzyme
MKTGTPLRVDVRSLDFTKMNEEKEMLNQISSYSDVTSPLVHQRSCHMTYTSLDVHDILREGFDRSNV